jgi:hypothetical protein
MHQRRGDCDWMQLKQEALAEMEAEAVRALMLAKVGLERHLLDTHVETILRYAQFNFDEEHEPQEHDPQHEPLHHPIPPVPIWDLDLARLPFFAEPMAQGDAW